MTTDASELSEREQRLGEVVFACLQAAEQGEPLDRLGVLARHPEFASELRDFFSAQDKVNRLAAPLREAARAARDEETVGRGPTPQLGEYRILREVARGGMGIVYEAVQLSLNRHVALKVLPLHRVGNASHL